MTTPARPYKTLLRGTLVQRSAFSIGGNQPHGGSDHPIARDGKDRYIIRGSGLAGALIATARSLLTPGKLPGAVSHGPPGEEQDRKRAAEQTNSKEQRMRLPESHWRFHHAHLAGSAPVITELRSGVAIRHDTGAAAEHLKFDTETIPAGTRWDFLLEIDDFRCFPSDKPEDQAHQTARCEQVRTLALKALKAWQDGYCFLGRDIARGLGWMQLEDLQVKALDTNQVTAWPNAHLEPLEAFDKLPSSSSAAPASLITALENAREPGTLASGTLTIEVGSHIQDPTADDAWGLDTLSVGAAEDLRPLQEQQFSPEKIGLPPLDNAEPDLTLAWTRPAGDPSATPRPYLPGSGLRGPLRHALSWLLRRRGIDVTDPSASHGAPGRTDPAAMLFGTVDRSARLLLSDAELEDPDDYRLLFLEHHAEDEFTGGAYGSSKFNRLALQSGRFTAHWHLEADKPEQLKAHLKHLRQLAALGAAQQLAIGGGQWRGHGWVRWTWTGLEEPAAENAQ